MKNCFLNYFINYKEISLIINLSKDEFYFQKNINSINPALKKYNNFKKNIILEMSNDLPNIEWITKENYIRRKKIVIESKLYFKKII